MKQKHYHQWEYDERFRTCMICFKIEMCHENVLSQNKIQIGVA